MPSGPHRALGLWTATALVVGNMIGSGVFLLPASLGAFGGISVLGWLVTTAGAVVLALVFADLARIVPGAGGPYAYTRRGLGDFAGYLVAWGYWNSIWIGNAAIAIAFAGYASVFWPAVAESAVLAAAVAMAALWLVTGVNAAGVREAGRLQLATTLLKLAPLVAIGTLGFLWFEPGHLVPFNASPLPDGAALNATIALTLWAFLGLESATVPADHVRDASRAIPIATIGGTLAAAVVYVLGTVAVMGVVAPADLARSASPFADAAEAMWGPWARYAVGAGAAIACFGALNGWVLLQGQVPRAAADDRLFPAAFGRVTGGGAPVFGLVLSSVLVTALVAMNYTRGLVGLFTFAILLATLVVLLPYLLSTVAYVRILAVEPGARRGARIRGPIAIAVLALAYSLWAIAGLGAEAILWGVVLLAAGVPLYGLILRRRPRPAGASRP